VSRSPAIDKSAVREALLTRLREELASRFKAGREAEAGATDPQNKAENKYDTRGLELSYLAAGQSRQIAQLEANIAEIQSMPLRDFAPTEAAGVGALVTVAPASGTEETVYFLAPGGGGTELTMGRREIVVITPASPLGQQLVGQKKDHTFALGRSGPSQRIVGVR